MACLKGNKAIVEFLSNYQPFSGRPGYLSIISGNLETVKFVYEKSTRYYFEYAISDCIKYIYSSITENNIPKDSYLDILEFLHRKEKFNHVSKYTLKHFRSHDPDFIYKKILTFSCGSIDLVSALGHCKFLNDNYLEILNYMYKSDLISTGLDFADEVFGESRDFDEKIRCFKHRTTINFSDILFEHLELNSFKFVYDLLFCEIQRKLTINTEIISFEEKVRINLYLSLWDSFFKEDDFLYCVDEYKIDIYNFLIEQKFRDFVNIDGVKITYYLL